MKKKHWQMSIKLSLLAEVTLLYQPPAGFCHLIVPIGRQSTYQSHSLVQNQFTNLCLQFPLIGFRANCEQKTFMTYIGLDDSRTAGSLKDPISAPNGTEK